MGRGRGRGRGKASVTASPVASAIEPSVDSCLKTTYDGVDDSFASSDALLKIAGAQTWCCELYIPTGTSFTGVSREALSNFKYPELRGFAIARQDTRWYINCPRSGVELYYVTTTPFDTWVKLVMRVSSNNNINMWVDEGAGFVEGTGGNGDINTNPLGTSTFDFTIGDSADVPAFHDPWIGSIRNVEVYTGAASNPTSWTPGDTGSLSGVSLVLQCAEGNGTNDQSISFTENGDPVTEAC